MLILAGKIVLVLIAMGMQIMGMILARSRTSTVDIVHVTALVGNLIAGTILFCTGMLIIVLLSLL